MNKIELLDKLKYCTPYEFESLIEMIYTVCGYTILRSPMYKEVHGIMKPLPDGGIDMIIEKDGIHTFLQLKKKITRKVPIATPRELLGSTYNKRKVRDRLLIITTHKFSKPSSEFCEDNGIDMIEGEELVERICGLKGKNAIIINSYIEALSVQQDYVTKCAKKAH